MQLRFASFAVINLRRDLHPQECARAGRTASSAAASLAGRIAAAHQRLEIVNRGRNGTRFADLTAQFVVGERHDAVLILAGGNDVIRRTPPERLARDIDATLAAAAAQSPLVIVIPAGNVGNAPLLRLTPLAGGLTQRSRGLQALVRDAAGRHGAVHVDLFREHADDPFVQQRDLTAADGLHPSDAGYRLWHDELMKQTALGSVLASAR